MKMKKKFQRILTGSLAVLLCVSMNINPIATIAGAIAESGVVDDLGNIKDHLLAIATDNSGIVHAEETGETTPGETSVTVNCDHSDAIDDLMGDDDIDLTDLNNTIGTGFTTIGGYIDGVEQNQEDLLNALGYTATATLAGDVENIQTQLDTIHDDLTAIKDAITDQQHKYFVAHLYSLNNSLPNAMWRPYSEDVPYVEDFATVWGGFANVYSGYWDTAVTEPTGNLWWRKTYESSNPDEFIYDYDRYAEVLGDDIIIAAEGVIIQNNAIKNNSAGTFTGYSNSNFFGGDTDGKSPISIINLYQETIDENAVTWLDAITVLYKAVGQELYSYQSFMTYDPTITPETSPAFQNLANPIPNGPKDSIRPNAYNGYDVYFFTTRANPVVPNQTLKDGEEPQRNNIYWTKAMKDGFVPSSSNVEALQDTPITASEFWKLAEDMMTAYGEPTINDAEVKALLQVYGTDYPVQLGYQVADAWAYLKVRGCLECPMEAGDGVTRAQLLDVATRIKDEEYRADYKVITVTLDLADVMQDSGYYPVNNLTTTTDSFSSTTEYRYSDMTYYSYLIGVNETCNLGTLGSYRVYSDKDRADSKVIDGYSVIERTVAGKTVLEVRVPIEYGGNIYVAKTTFDDPNQSPNGTVDFICIPSSGLGGGVYNKWTIDDTTKIATVSTADGDIIPFSDYSMYEELIECNDYLRAGKEKPTAAVASVDATVLESLAFIWDEWTSPMVAYAAPASNSNTPINVTIKTSGDAGTNTKVAEGLDSILSNKIPNKFDGTAFGGTTSDKIFPDSTSTEVFAAPADNELFLSIYRAQLLTTGNTTVQSQLKNGASSLTSLIVTSKSIPDAASVQWAQTIKADNAALTMSNIPNGSSRGSVSYNAVQMAILWKYGIVPDYNVLSDSNISTNRMASTVSFSTLISSGSMDKFKGTFSADGFDDAKEWVKTLGCTSVTVADSSISFRTTKPSDVLAKFDKDASGYDPTSGQQTGTNDESRLDLPTTVTSDAIMRKDQQILLKWSDLIACDYVVAEADGSLPKLQSDGSLYFFTKHGQVKVNNTKGTIQIGTVLYDLSAADGTTPTLYYFDTEQSEKGELYIDYRCVLGVVKERISYDDDANTAVIQNDTLGAGGAVVYNLGSATTSNQFTTKSVLTYNYPEIPNAPEGTNNLGNVNGYAIDVISSTYYDTLETGNGTAVYWPTGTSSSQVRMAVSSFVPTANWIVVIDQASEDDISAHLFIWYPKEPFVNGFDNGSGDIIQPTKNADEAVLYSGWVDTVTNANAMVNSRSSLKSALDSAYEGWETTTDWYIQMSCNAAAQLYQLTGQYYISGDYIMRWVDLTNTSVTKAVNTFNKNQADNECIANSAGVIYWVPNIGYVYNLPSVDNFTLEKYFNGEYLLPLAVDLGGITGGPNIINYNMPYYGYYATKDASGSWTYTNKIAYGNVLSSNGIYNYKGTQKIGLDALPNVDNLSDEEKNITPIQFSSFDTGEAGNANNCFTAAPAGVYIYFGSNPLEEQSIKGITNFASYKNSIYFGTNQMLIESSDTLSSNLNISLFGTKYADFAIPSTAVAHRTLHTAAKDVLVVEPVGLKYTDTNGVVQIQTEDAPTNEIIDWLEGLGSNDLLHAIDDGASWMIIFAFQVLPWIGIILMMILIGLSFITDVKVFQIICEKTIDPIRILTFGGRDMYNWKWQKVLFPCIILFVAFALFLNGNIIRIIMWGAEWYGIIVQWFKTL